MTRGVANFGRPPGLDYVAVGRDVRFGANWRRAAEDCSCRSATIESDRERLDRARPPSFVRFDGEHVCDIRHETDFREFVVEADNMLTHGKRCVHQKVSSYNRLVFSRR